MLIFDTVSALQAHLKHRRAAGDKIGFAPTMGALHQGHLELIRMANQVCECSVASIFVNPTQFNDPKDLEKYPRMPEKDANMLISAGCDVLFMPSVQEVYPIGEDLTLVMDFGDLEKVMEGKFRPGHFAGMATVVNRLLNIVNPDLLYMGQKDYQQLSIVRDMLRQLKSPIELVMCPTVREPDGLAMSSRNMRLSTEMRAAAPVIHQALQTAKVSLPEKGSAIVSAAAIQSLIEAGLRPEYFDIVDGITLQPVSTWHDSSFIVACTAAFAGEIRLIDNLVLKQ